MTLEEQRLAEMLHRLTPEPPRTVTVEDVAIQLANQAAPRRARRSGAPRRSDNVARTDRAFGDGQTSVLRIGKRGRPRFVPALAAASVIAVVGASAGIAVALTSSHHNTKSPSAGTLSTSASASTPASSPDDTTPPGNSGTHPAEPKIPVAGGMWGAELIVQQSLNSGTLVSGGTSLYALSDGYLVRIDPSKAQIMAQARAQGGTDRPVVDGDKVWVAAAASGGGLTLSAFNATTLAPAGTVAVPGGVTQPEGALAAGPDGDLYVAAGSSVAVIDPSSDSVIRHMPVSGGEADSVAITPDGGTVYAGVEGGGHYSLEAFNAGTGATLGGGSAMGNISTAGFLVATDGGVWGTTGMLMTQRVWFAPGGDLSRVRPVTSGVDGGLDSVPTYANGAIWVGGIQSLECLNPSTGNVRASGQIPTDSGVPEHFGSVAFVAGDAYATFQDQHAQQGGVAAVTPPAACGTSGTTGS